MPLPAPLVVAGREVGRAALFEVLHGFGKLLEAGSGRACEYEQVAASAAELARRAAVGECRIEGLSARLQGQIEGFFAGVGLVLVLLGALAGLLPRLQADVPARRQPGVTRAAATSGPAAGAAATGDDDDGGPEVVLARARARALQG